MADNTTELEVLDQIVDVLGGQSGQYETVVPTLQQIRDLLGGGGGRGGYNPSLSVGRADALTGADEAAQWAQRTTTGSGTATVRSVQGAAVAWNQLIKNGNFESTANWTTNGTGSVSDGVYTSTRVASTYLTFKGLNNSAQTVAGHKYLFLVDAMSANGKITFIPTDTTAGGTRDFTGITTMQRIGWIWAPEGGLSNTFTIRNTTTTYGTEEQLSLSIANYNCFDLTEMFGSGNEPATVAEFERMYPEAYYPYSAPTLKPVQIAGIASTDAQGGELDSVEWDTYTLRGAGAVGDMLYSDHVETRVGVITLRGNVTYVQTSQDGTCTNVQVQPSGFSAVNNGGLASDQFTKTTASWLGVGLGEGRLTSTGIFIGLPLSVTSNAEANAWLAEHKPTFWYELATPTTQPISPALPMTYKMQAGGSESIIVPDGEISAVPLITLAEGESASELVMDALACIAAPDGTVATANHSVGTYLTMGGKLYKVTSAIAVGETITPNTNVTETTVMAELIARTA